MTENEIVIVVLMFIAFFAIWFGVLHIKKTLNHTLAEQERILRADIRNDRDDECKRRMRRKVKFPGLEGEHPYRRIVTEFQDRFGLTATQIYYDLPVRSFSQEAVDTLYRFYTEVDKGYHDNDR